MKVQITEKGKNKGRVSVTRTLSTLAVGESWTTNTSEVDLRYVRVACTYMARHMNREFTVSNTLDMGEVITIKRTA